ncbi:hypothetical protein ACROYT_G012470 [Oculina patagonica]
MKVTSSHPEGMIGTVFCKLLTGGNVAWIGAVSSFVTLVAIAIERYYAVVYPLRNKGDLTERKLKGVMRVQKRVTMMVVAVTATFGIVWLTDEIAHAVDAFLSYSIDKDVYTVAHTMIVFSSAVNPFVYALINKNYREKIKGILCCGRFIAVIHPAAWERHSIELVSVAPRPTHIE